MISNVVFRVIYNWSLDRYGCLDDFYRSVKEMERERGGRRNTTRLA